jgi:hypothetical protein
LLHDTPALDKSRKRTELIKELINMADVRTCEALAVYSRWQPTQAKLDMLDLP